MNLDCQVLKVLLVFKGFKVHQDNKVLLDRLDSRDHLALKAHEVSRVPLEVKVKLVNQVKLVHRVP